MAKTHSFAVTGPSKGREWRFHSKAVVDWLRAQDVEQALDATDTLDIEAARLRKVLAEAQLAELELAKQKGQVAPIERMNQIMIACFMHVRKLPGASVQAGRADA